MTTKQEKPDLIKLYIGAIREELLAKKPCSKCKSTADFLEIDWSGTTLKCSNCQHTKRIIELGAFENL